VPDDKGELSPVGAELEDLLLQLWEARGPTLCWWEVGTDLPPAIKAGLGWPGRLELLNVQADWFEHPHYANRYIRIQNGKLAMPGAALPADEERRVLEDVKGPMFFSAVLSLTQAEKTRRTIRKEVQAALDYQRRHTRSRKKPTELVTAISKRLAAGEEPGSTVQWNSFCDSVRDDCAGWADTKNRTPKRGFSDKSIKRIVERKRRS
jgi:hypothetical protein